jgi:hypothetical protein
MPSWHLPGTDVEGTRSLRQALFASADPGVNDFRTVSPLSGSLHSPPHPGHLDPGHLDHRHWDRGVAFGRRFRDLQHVRGRTRLRYL